MARRPDPEKAEKLTEEDLKELRHNLAHLSVTAVRDFYEQAYPGLPVGPQPSSEAPKDAATSAGVEAVVEVALIGEKDAHESCRCPSP